MTRNGPSETPTLRFALDRSMCVPRPEVAVRPVALPALMQWHAMLASHFLIVSRKGNIMRNDTRTNSNPTRHHLSPTRSSSPKLVCDETGQFIVPRGRWMLINAMSKLDAHTAFVVGGRPQATTIRRAIHGYPKKHAELCAKIAIRVLTESSNKGNRVERKLDFPDGQRVSIAAIPVPGRSGSMQAAHLWVGAVPTNQSAFDQPGRVGVATLEFDAARLVKVIADEGFQPPMNWNPGESWTIAALLDRVGRFDEKLAFLSLFDQPPSRHEWRGSLVFDDDQHGDRLRHVRIAARVTDQPEGCVVRANAADVTDTSRPWPPDLIAAQQNRLQPAPGRFTGTLDLATTIVFDWKAAPHPVFDGWRHGNPQWHEHDFPALLQILGTLDAGYPATATLRLRFADTDPWLTVEARCTPISHYERKLGLIDGRIIGATS